jgi:hypothetical protein
MMEMKKELTERFLELFDAIVSEAAIATHRRVIDDLKAKGEDTTDAVRCLEMLLRCRHLRRRRTIRPTRSR